MLMTEQTFLDLKSTEIIQKYLSTVKLSTKKTENWPKMRPKNAVFF